MKAYIQTDKQGDYFNVNAFVATVGFKSLGFEAFKYGDADEVSHTEQENYQNVGLALEKRLQFPIKKLSLPDNSCDTFRNLLRIYLHYIRIYTPL
ncbi:MAG: hypothetical protein R8P61_11170 [Bacteroidia bacterium]|nr:hypothetical protein [Bacteroidia bacterium]